MPVAISNKLAGSGVMAVGWGSATPTLNPVSVSVISLFPPKKVAEIAPAAVPVRSRVSPDPMKKRGTELALRPSLLVAKPVT